MSVIKKCVAFLAIFAAVFPLASCGGSQEDYQSRTFYAMNTLIEIYISAGENVEALMDECENTVYAIEAEVSKTRSMSDISILNENGNAECGEHTTALLKASEQVNTATDGAFDPTLEPLTNLWEELDGGDKLPDSETLSETLSLIGMDKLTLNGNNASLANRSGIDLGGIAKGYTAGRIVELIASKTEEYAVTGGILSFGGAVSVFGKKANGSQYRVAVRDPDDKNGIMGYIRLTSGHISVSGDYERYFTVGGKQYHHILDPKTGYPAESGLRSVAVICDDGGLSDALSTALLVMGYDKAMELYDSGVFAFEAVFIMSDKTVKTTPAVDFSEE